MPLDRYQECEVRVYTQEKTERKERKRKMKKGRQSVVFSRKTVPTVGNRTRLLTWGGVLEETKLRLRKERTFCGDRRYLTWASGARTNSAKIVRR